jgi:hypothetical protein
LPDELLSKLCIADVIDWWIWKHLVSYTIACLLLWLILIIITARVVMKTQKDYQPISSQEKKFLSLKNNLRKGHNSEEV